MSDTQVLPETLLIKRAQQGDEQAFDQLVLMHRDAVFRLAYLLIGQADEAEDIAQETFIRALKQLHRFDTTYALRPWLLQITANLARNRYRSWWRYRKYLDRFFHQEREEAFTPEQETQAQFQALALWQVVQQLPRPQQEIVYLRYFLELSLQDTAEALTLPVGTVKSRQHRALTQLKGLLQAEHPDLIEAFL